MTILMIGFDNTYALLLKRAINDTSVDFVTEATDGLVVDLVIVNGDDGESVRCFADFRRQHNCAAFIASYSTEEKIGERFEDIRIPISTESACHFFSMPLALCDLTLALKEPELGYTEPLPNDVWKKQKEDIETAQIRGKVQGNEHREKNIRGAGKMLDALLDLRIIDASRHREIAERLIHLEREPTQTRTKVRTSRSLPSRAPTILLIDDDAVFAQWGAILGELFAAERISGEAGLSAKLEYATRLSEGTELLQRTGATYAAVLLDVRFVDEGKSAADLWVDKESEKLLKKIPIVMFSADADGRVVKTCLLDRAVDYFIKDDVSQSGIDACRDLVGIMQRAMNEDRRWIFADALERVSPLIPNAIRKEALDDLDDAVRNLFRKPKLALFCMGCVYETRKGFRTGGTPDAYYSWILGGFRNISAHNIFRTDVEYHPLDAEIPFWAFMALCNLQAARQGQSPITFEAHEYIAKLRNLISTRSFAESGLSEVESQTSQEQKSTNTLDRLEELLSYAVIQRYSRFFEMADSIIGEYLQKVITAYYDEKPGLGRDCGHRRPTDPASAIHWFRSLNFEKIRENDPRTLLAIALTGKEGRPTMNRVVRPLPGKLKSLGERLGFRLPIGEHLALFAAICVRLSLISDSSK